MMKIRRTRKGKTRRELKRRPINVLASAITAFGLYWGLVSIFLSARERYDLAAFAILGAIVCDALDGTVARLTKSTSEFGKEFDSLCDLVAFGVAPAVLIYFAYLREEQMAGTLVGRTGSFMAIVFVLCGALRLARFNVYQSGFRDSFTGLPIPAAGGTIASLVLFTEYWNLRVAFWVLGPFTLLLAALMVSPIRYPKDRMKKGLVFEPRNAFRALVFVVLAIAAVNYMLLHSPAMVLLPLCLTYIGFGIVDDALTRWRARRGVAAPAAEDQPSVVPFTPPENKEEAL